MVSDESALRGLLIDELGLHSTLLMTAGAAFIGTAVVTSNGPRRFG